MKPAKFPNSSQLFKFCQKVLNEKKGKKINDQDIGSMLNFNPSDCSHWKKGEKNVKSVFAHATLAKELGVEITLIHDLACGLIGLDEAYFEYSESRSFEATYKQALSLGEGAVEEQRRKIEDFVSSLHKKAEFRTPPLYLPEIIRFFPFITGQMGDMMDRLSRVLRTRPQQYVIQYRKGELKPQTRMSIAVDLARILLEGERERYLAELGSPREELSMFERNMFVATLLIPKPLMVQEMGKLDARKNITSELASVFWVPKSLVSFQLQDSIREPRKEPRRTQAADLRRPFVSDAQTVTVSEHP